MALARTRIRQHAGRYDVYINVYEEAERFHGEVTVEAYVGNGISSCLVDIVQCTLQVCHYCDAVPVRPYFSHRYLLPQCLVSGIRERARNVKSFALSSLAYPSIMHRRVCDDEWI